VRVGIDYLPAVTHAPGVGRYARELVRALVRLEQAPKLCLVEVGGARAEIGEPALGLAGALQRPRRLRLRVPRRWIGRLRLSADRLLGGVDVFHHIHAGWPPVSRAARVFAVSELPERRSEGAAKLACQLAEMDRLIVFSAHGARRLSEDWGVAAERVHQVAVGCEHWRRSFPELPAVDPIPTLVVLGAVSASRRHERIVAAFERLWEQERAGRLLILGQRGDAADLLDACLSSSPAREAIHWIERPREGQLPGAVARAAAVVHLSGDELTPVTPLEVLCMGRPVVASRLPAFEEAVAPAARLVDPQEEEDPAALASAIAEELEAGEEPGAQDRRRALAERFSWDRCARETAEVWRTAGQGS